MAGSCNEQGGDSVGNDWRTQHEPDLRRKVIFLIVEKLKIRFHQLSENDIKNMTFRFEDEIYGIATDKDDYLRRLRRKVLSLNQGQSLSTSLPYTQTPTSQQWLPESNIQSNLNSPESSFGLPTQAPITTVSAPQNLNIQVSEEGVHSNILPGPQREIQKLLTQAQQQQQSSRTMFQHPMDQQLPYMQHQARHQQQSLLNQPIQQQLPHHASLTIIEQSSPQSSPLSSLPSSGEPNSQMAVPFHEQEQPQHENLISQLMNGQDTQQNHLTSLQNKGEEQEQTPRVSTSQQNNMASFNVHGSSLLGTSQGQEVEQSQPMMEENRILKQQLDNTQGFQAEGSLRLADQQNQQCQLQRTHPADPSSTSGGDDWREETYQKIKALREKYVHVLSTMLQTFSDKIREIDYLRQQNMKPHETVEWPKASKATLEQVLEFLNVCKSSVSEFHRDKFNMIEGKVLRFNVCHQTLTRRSMQKQQQQVYQQPQKNQQQLQIRETEWKDVRIRVRVNSKSEFEFQQHLSSSQRQRQLPKPMASPEPISVESPVSNANQIQTESQEHPLVTLPPGPLSDRPIDRLINTIQSSSPESLGQSINEISSVISMSDRFVGSFDSTRGSRASLAGDLSERTRLRLQQGDTNSTKRFKRSVNAMPLDSSASSATKVNKIEPSYALLQEITEINGRLVETVVNICNEDVCPSEVTSGTIVTCSYVPVALSATFKALYSSGHISQIQPLRLLVPENYPYSPIILDKVLFDTASAHKYEDLSERTRWRFGLSTEDYSVPMSLKKIAKVWDVCARATMVEYAERHGGDTFSSKYGRWESVRRAS